MSKKMIYKDGSSRLDIEFDGEYFQITQETFELTENTISVTLEEIEQLLSVAKKQIMGDKILKWSNGAEWGEIEHPELGMVMTYWKSGTPCYDTYTAPMVDADGDIYCYRFDHDEGCWKEDTIYIGTYEGETEIAFG